MIRSVVNHPGEPRRPRVGGGDGNQCSVEMLQRVLGERILTLAGSVQPPTLREAVSRSLHGGKRIRPLLTMMMCGAVGGRSLDALDPAVSVEFLHSASLIHDDIMDRSDIRRGVPTIHKSHGLGNAILAGDLLTALAFHCLSRFRHEREGLIMQSFTGAFVETCEGQSMDISLKEGTADLVHRRMVEKKTARLMQSASEIGALVGSADAGYVSAAREFGFCLGMAYQAFDDVQDSVGSTAVTGKPGRIDARNGRVTFVSGVEGGGRRKDHGAGAVLLTVRSYHDRALRALEYLPATPWKDTLKEASSVLISASQVRFNS